MVAVNCRVSGKDSAKCSNYGMPSVTRTLNTSKDCPEKRFSGNGFQKLREFFIYMEIRKFVFKYCPSFISPSNLCVCVLVVVCTSIHKHMKARDQY